MQCQEVKNTVSDYYDDLERGRKTSPSFLNTQFTPVKYVPNAKNNRKNPNYYRNEDKPSHD